MKIGPIDLSVTLIAYIAGLIFSLIVLTAMWSSGSSLRVESALRTSIYHAMNDSDPEAVNGGAEKCQFLIDHYPDRVAVYLCLGSILCKQEKWAEAQKAFATAAEKPNASSEEKTWATIGGSVAGFNAATNKGTNKTTCEKAALECEKILQQAMVLPENKANPNLLINMALVQQFKSQPDAAADMQKWCDQANAVPANSPASSASLKAQEQLYVLTGKIRSAESKFDEAVAAWKRALGIRPGAPDLGEGHLLSLLGMVTQEKMDPKTRREMTAKYQASSTNFGPWQCSAFTAFGISWSRLTEFPESLVNVDQDFHKAMSADPKNGRPVREWAAFLEQRINALAATLSADVTALRGETVPFNIWSPTISITEKTNASCQRFPIKDISTLEQIRGILKPENPIGLDKTWTNYLATIKAATPAERVDAKLRLLSAIRRSAFLIDFQNDAQRPIIMKRATDLMNELLKDDPTNPVVQFTAAELWLDKEDYTEAYKAFKACVDGGNKSPELASLVEKLGQKPEVIDRRPADKHRWFGSRPLIGATLRTAFGGRSSKILIQMKIDNKPVDTTVVGTQVFYIPSDKDLGDGEHKVGLSLASPIDPVPFEFPPVSLAMDKKPPTWTVAPDNKEPLSPRAVWVVELADESGIDTNSLTITISNGGVGKGSARPIIENGKYKTTQSDLGIKPGAYVDVEKPIKFSNGMDLPNGECRLGIVVRDIFGNELKDAKVYTVSGSASDVVIPVKKKGGTIKFDPNEQPEK